MPSKIKRPKKFSITKAVKSNARDRIGQPQASRIIPGKKAPRYKPNLLDGWD